MQLYESSLRTIGNVMYLIKIKQKLGTVVIA